MKHRGLLALATYFSAVTISYGANRLPDFGKVPLSFEANRGQTDGQVKFLAHGQDYTLFLTESEAVFSSTRSAALRMRFLRANPRPEISGVDEQAGKSNYFIGNDPKKWRSNVPTYAKVQYRNIYSGIDLVYYGNQRQLEYDFVVGPGADPRQIGFDVRGASKISRSADGDLVLRVGEREIRWHKPVVYQLDGDQEDRGARREIAGRYVIRGKDRVGFELARYDRSRTLFIDPMLVYSTYLGGSGDDRGYGIAADSSGAAYVVGTTGSADFPTMNPFQPANGNASAPSSDTNDGYPVATNAFVAKFNPSGSALVYSTYLGGSGNYYQQESPPLPLAGDSGWGIAVDSAGNAYIAGSTASYNFPVVNAFQSTNNSGQGFYGYQGFVTKLNPSGSALVYSTYLGGNGDDRAKAIAIDSTGAAYVTGVTESTNFPTVNPVQANQNSTVVDNNNRIVGNAFVTKFNPSGSALVYSTYLGGSGNGVQVCDGLLCQGGDIGQGIAVDSSGAAYIVGSTGSIDFPTQHPFQATNKSLAGFQTAFVAKFSPSGSTLVYSTYLGGSGFDQGNGIAVDSAGAAYVTGITSSTDFPTANPFQPNNAASAGYDNAFVTKFNASGSALVYSTYLGGSGSYYFPNDGDLGNGGHAIAVDSSGSAYVVGGTASAAFPTVNPFETAVPGGGAFITKIIPSGELLVYSTYMGNGVAYGVAVDSLENVYVTGSVGSALVSGPPEGALPIVNPFQATNHGGNDAFVTKIAFNSVETMLKLSETAWTFGPTVVGSATPQANVYVTNTGSSTAHFMATPLVSALAGLQFDTTCGPTLAAGAFCVVQFSYKASALGTVNGTLTLLSDAANSPNVIQVAATGSGVLPQFLSWNFSSIPVGTIRATGKIYLKSETPVAMNLSSTVVTLAGADPGDFSLTDDCSAAVAPYQSCELLFAFAPKVVGFRQAEIVIKSPQIQNGQLIISITGYAEPAP